MGRARSRIERLEREVAMSVPPDPVVPVITHWVVGADGRYTGELFRQVGAGPRARGFAPDRAGVPAPGTLAAREEEAGRAGGSALPMDVLATNPTTPSERRR